MFDQLCLIDASTGTLLAGGLTGGVGPVMVEPAKAFPPGTSMIGKVVIHEREQEVATIWQTTVTER